MVGGSSPVGVRTTSKLRSDGSSSTFGRGVGMIYYVLRQGLPEYQSDGVDGCEQMWMPKSTLKRQEVHFDKTSVISHERRTNNVIQCVHGATTANFLVCEFDRRDKLGEKTRMVVTEEDPQNTRRPWMFTFLDRRAAWRRDNQNRLPGIRLCDYNAPHWSPEFEVGANGSR
ncbi:hypothetical protein ARMGADRAFT_1027627 [Armillaria gallica]|uniref:Uncharacterized protein n=1 Tax=Armillaria gallica TaxID=47427 RepID=A0A2H3E7R9_ARMGA|nr:hypothetical protein ARMGADRAFT_1027627 [Armillaria gallica]